MRRSRAVSATRVRIIDQGKPWPNAAVFSPDGKSLITGEAGGVIRLWDVATGREHGPSLGQPTYVSGLTLSRVWNKPGEATFLKPLYRTSVPITLNQTLVLGASRDEASKSALILILLAEEAPRADAAKGAAGAKAAEKKK